MRTDPRSPVPPVGPVVAVLAVLAAGAATITQIWHIASVSSVGGDFEPLRRAAQAMLSGTSVYGDPAFVYPPSAAVPLLVTAIGSATLAWGIWAALGVGALLVAAVQIARQSDPKWRVRVGGGCAFVLVIGCATSDSLDLGNLSVLLVPVVIAALVALGHGRWLLGCGVLCASLLIKPLLLPLLAVPLLYGHGRELVRAAVPAALVLALSIAFVPGGSRFPHVFAYDLSGTDLHGANARNNLSIAGWLEAHTVAPDLSTAVRAVGVAVVVAVAAAALARLRRQDADVATIAQTGNLVMVTVLLSGSISEVHFLVVLLASSLLQLTVRPSPRAAACLLPGIAMLGTMTAYRSLIIGSSPPQSWYLVAELALLLGNAVEVFTRFARQPAPVLAGAAAAAT